MLGKTLDRVSGSLGKNIEFSRHFWIAKAASPCWSSRLGVIKKHLQVLRDAGAVIWGLHKNYLGGGGEDKTAD